MTDESDLGVEDLETLVQGQGRIATHFGLRSKADLLGGNIQTGLLLRMRPFFLVGVFPSGLT